MQGVRRTHRIGCSFALTIASGLILVIAGCGGSDTDGRVEVSGLVTLDGQPLDDAHITLIPESSGPAVSGAITGGEFRLGAAEGPAVGPYFVEIDAVRPTGRTIEHPDLFGETTEETENIIPPQFNRRSTLRVEVVADGDNRFEFAVTTR